MIKKVCKNEISVLFVFYLIVLKYLIKNKESTFAFYLYRLIIGSFFQERKASEISDILEQEDKKLSRKNTCCEEDFSVLDGGSFDYGFRDYSPIQMRFTTVDPIKSGPNWYAYVGNDPINLIDPFGLTASDSNLENGPNWDLVKEGLTGMVEATVTIIAGAAITQLDTPSPEPMDVIGAGIVVKGIADETLNYGKVVSGLVGVDKTEIPGDILNATVDAITGNDELGDIVEEISDYLIGEFK